MIKRILVSLCTGVLIALVFSVPVRADVNDFVIDTFEANYTLTNNDPQGELAAVENIAVTYSDNNHGILRALPKTYNNHSLALSIRTVTSPSGAPAQYSTYEERGNTVLKIGDPTKTITGKQAYRIEYVVRNVIGFYGDHDELYWDINGDQWKQSTTDVRATINTPAGIYNGQLTCFAEVNGGVGTDCEARTAADQHIIRTTTLLGPEQTLTVVVGLKTGYFTPPSFLDWFKDNALAVVSVALPPLLFGGWALRRWYKLGRDRRGRGIVVPEYGVPDKLSPMEVGMIYDYKLETKDVTATIIDLAIKKYLRIVEIKEKKVLKDKTQYSFVLLKNDISQLKHHEQEVLKGIFPSLGIGDEVKLTDLHNKFYKTIASVQKSVPEHLTLAGYFDSNPMKAGNRLYILAGVLFFGGFVLGRWITLGFALSAIIVFLFALLMPRRSAQGVLTKEAIEGLKLYLNTAEKDRIQYLQSVDAAYRPKSHEPKMTVELFEKLLPYAMVLGVEGTWAKQFESIYTKAPDWYSGNWSTFNSAYLVSSLNNSVSAMGGNFSAPSSSSSSGFGGGGFSGGGGGGGGGGGW